jgi:hypothetical protein
MTTYDTAKAAKVAKAMLAMSSAGSPSTRCIYPKRASTVLASLVLMTDSEIERDRLNELSNRVIGAALRVHEEIGPGMLESACEACLMFELLQQGLRVEREKTLPLFYRGPTPRLRIPN